MKEKCIFKNPKIAMVILVMALMIAGALNVYSASFAMMGYGKGYFSGYIARYLLFGVIGLILMGWLGWKMDYHQLLGRRAEMAIAFINIVFLYPISLVLLAFVTLMGIITGDRVNGAARWMTFMGLQFQPSELAKLAIILLGAAYLGKVMEQGKKPSLVNHFSFAVVIIGLLVFKQPDMGTSAILIAIAFFLYILAGLPTLMVIGTILIGAVGAVVGVVIAPYRLNRIYVWLDPFRDPQGLGYQMVQSKVAIGSGGFGGLGPGQGLGKYFYLPEAHTDFAFSVFCQEHGFLGAFVLIVLFLMLGYVIYTVARRTRDHQGFLLVMGANFLIVGQAFANMAMVCGILPVIGVPLSFISYGGTSLVTTLLAMGLVFSVYHDEVRREEKEAPPTLPLRHSQRPPFVGTPRYQKDRWKK